MNFLNRLLSFGRVRRAKRALAAEPTPRNYLVLAQQYALAGRTGDAQRTCVEGLGAFPENIQLSRYHQRTTRAER